MAAVGVGVGGEGFGGGVGWRSDVGALELKRAYRKRMWPWECRGPWEGKVDFSDMGLGVEGREADRSGGTNGTGPGGLGPADPF